MSDATPDRVSLRRKQHQFQVEKENRVATLYREMETERSIGDAKTAKLRAQRLAREEAERGAVVKK